MSNLKKWKDINPRKGMRDEAGIQQKLEDLITEKETGTTMITHEQATHKNYNHLK